MKWWSVKYWERREAILEQRHQPLAGRIEDRRIGKYLSRLWTPVIQEDIQRRMLWWSAWQ